MARLKCRTNSLQRCGFVRHTTTKATSLSRSTTISPTSPRLTQPSYHRACGQPQAAPKPQACNHKRASQTYSYGTWHTSRVTHKCIMIFLSDFHVQVRGRMWRFVDQKRTPPTLAKTHFNTDFSRYPTMPCDSHCAQHTM